MATTQVYRASVMPPLCLRCDSNRIVHVNRVYIRVFSESKYDQMLQKIELYCKISISAVISKNLNRDKGTAFLPKNRVKLSRFLSLFDRFFPDNEI